MYTDKNQCASQESRSFFVNDIICILHTLIKIVFFSKCYNLISGQKYKCEKPKLKNGKVKIRSRGQVARFRCWKFFKLHGAKIALCINDVWNLPVPICVGKRIKGLIQIIWKNDEKKLNIYIYSVDGVVSFQHLEKYVRNKI